MTESQHKIKNDLKKLAAILENSLSNRDEVLNLLETTKLNLSVFSSKLARSGKFFLSGQLARIELKVLELRLRWVERLIREKQISTEHSPDGPDKNADREESLS